MKERIGCMLILVAALVAGTEAFAQFPGMVPPKHYAWSDTSLSPDQRADLVIKEMTLEEKIQLLHGLGWQAMFRAAGFRSRNAGRFPARGFIAGIPRLGIPDLQMTDSVEGVAGASVRADATARLSGEAMAAAWIRRSPMRSGPCWGTRFAP